MTKFLGMTGLLALFCMTAVYAGQAKPAAPAAKASPESIANGEALFKRSCQTCHGPAGKGDGPAAKTLKGKLPDLSDKAVMAKLTDPAIHELVSNGKKSEIGNMPAMAKRLKPEEITDIVNYVRTLAK
ncbi:MAG: cytochrome c [Vicinamibacterales bacterium]|nr:cytochrome c [Vicinamibacterales bacterium]